MNHTLPDLLGSKAARMQKKGYQFKKNYDVEKITPVFSLQEIVCFLTWSFKYKS